MNALNRWRTHGYNSLADGQIYEAPAGVLTTAETKTILEQHIAARLAAGEDLRYKTPAGIHEANSS